MKKKLFSLVMAVAMVLSLAVPAFATDWHGWESQSASSEQTVSFAAKTFVPTIKITMPKIETNPVILNPYKIAFTVGSSGEKLNNQAMTAVDQTRQVVCPVYYIKNETDVDMNFAIKATTTAGGHLNLQSNHVAITATGNDALIQFVVTKSSEELASWSNAVGNIGAGLDAYDTVNNEVMTLTAGDVETSADSIGSRTLAKKGTNPTYLKMQFSGELSRNPSTPWDAGDTLSTTVVFTFTPISAPDFKSKLGAQTVAFAETSITQNSSFNLPTMTAAGVVSGNAIFDGTNTVPTAAPTAAGDVATPFTVHPTTPNWAVVSGAASVGAAIGGTANAPALTLDKEALKKLPTDGTPHDYHVLLSFDDKNSVPRTLDVTIPITRRAS